MIRVSDKELKELCGIARGCKSVDGTARSDLVLAAFPAVVKELQMHRKYWDDDILDGTDGAHPAWWRGHDDTIASVVQQINKLLDGKNGEKFGKSTQPYHRLYRRIYRLRRIVEDVTAIVSSTDDVRLAIELIKGVLPNAEEDIPL